MIVILIPFFLVAQIPVEENAWKFGAEYTFQVTANFTADAENIKLSSNSTSLLRCRPKNSDVLSCNLQIPEDFKSLYDKDQGINTTDSITNISNPCQNQFEIKFSKSGVDSLIVEKNISTWDLNIIKSVVNQLSFGTNLSEKQNQENFEEKENSTIGECKVNFKITHTPREQSARKDAPFILDVLPLADKVSKGIVEIEKTRNLKDCTNMVNYMWGNLGNIYTNLTQPDSDTQFESVIARMNITDTSFSSCTHTQATKNLESQKKNFKINEKVLITLKSIEAAKDKLPLIQNPGSTPILIKMNVQELKTNQ